MEEGKKQYYGALKVAQKSNEISDWINYFVNAACKAQAHAEAEIKFALKKAGFFDTYNVQVNKRQLKVIKRMLSEGPEGFEGCMSANKYMKIAKTSKAAATRDLKDLTDKGVLIPSGGGRVTAYEINLS